MSAHWTSSFPLWFPGWISNIQTLLCKMSTISSHLHIYVTRETWWDQGQCAYICRYSSHRWLERSKVAIWLPGQQVLIRIHYQVGVSTEYNASAQIWEYSFFVNSIIVMVSLTWYSSRKVCRRICMRPVSYATLRFVWDHVILTPGCDFWQAHPARNLS